MQDSTYGEIVEFLSYLGIPAHVRGYQYLLTILAADRDFSEMRSTDVYSYVSENCHVARSNIDRGIRNLILMSFENMPKDIKEKIFGNSLGKKTFPTNSQYLHSIILAYKYLRER